MRYTIELCVNLFDISDVKSNCSFLNQTGRPFASKKTHQNNGRYLKPKWTVQRDRSVKVDGPKNFNRESERSKNIKRVKMDGSEVFK